MITDDPSGLIVLLLGGAVSFGVLKKGQSDSAKEISKISAGVETLRSTTQTIATASAVQGQKLERMEIEQDDMKGDIKRHERDVNAMKEWRSAAEQRIHHVEANLAKGAAD